MIKINLFLHYSSLLTVNINTNVNVSICKISKYKNNLQLSIGNRNKKFWSRYRSIIRLKTIMDVSFNSFLYLLGQKISHRLDIRTSSGVSRWGQK